MRRAALAALLAVSACARPLPATVVQSAPAASPTTAPGPLVVPARGDGPALPSSETVLTRIAVGCCPEPGGDLPVLAAVAATTPQLLVLIDRTSGPMSDRAEAYGRLNLNAQFAAFNMAAPMVAAPGALLHGSEEEAGFEAYWTSAALGAERDGVYGSRIFGLPGRRVQLLVLSPEPDAAERAWLARELRHAAEVRVIVGPPEEPVTASGAVVRLSSTETGHGGAALAVPSLNGASSGFGLVEIDWPRERVLLSLRGLKGEVLSASTVTF